MKKLCFGFFSLIFCFFCAFPVGAYEFLSVHPGQIIITDQGMVVIEKGMMLYSRAIFLEAEGIYSAEVEYYGSCNKCGWPLSNDYKCTNATCRGDGPREQD